MEFINEYLEDLYDDNLSEMSNMEPERTGLSVFIYVSPKKHSTGPRIKVSNIKGKAWSEKDNFSVLISEKPRIVKGECKLSKKELEKIFKFVIINREVLLDYWNFKIDTTREMEDKLIKV